MPAHSKFGGRLTQKLLPADKAMQQTIPPVQGYVVAKELSIYLVVPYAIVQQNNAAKTNTMVYAFTIYSTAVHDNSLWLVPWFMADQAYDKNIPYLSERTLRCAGFIISSRA